MLKGSACCLSGSLQLLCCFGADYSTWDRESQHIYPQMRLTVRIRCPGPNAVHK